MFLVSRLRSPILAAFLFVLGLSLAAYGEDAKVKIPLPHRSKPTPVQKYNQDGVKEIRKHDYKKAKQLFYKAYLLDPQDPFTLNNLGYMAELEGDVDRAQSFYDLAQQSGSEAVVDKASEDNVEGQTLASVAGHAESGAMKVNLINVQAMSMLQKDRAPEADLLLAKALQVDSKNPFTLNNMGYAKELEGELEQAVKYYQQAASTRSKEAVVVAGKSSWRGRPISEIASDNAKKAQRALAEDTSVEARLTRFNLRGVSALNRNDRKAAREYFMQAYKLNPRNAFTLNNMGYLAELDGDKETANSYYMQARVAENNGATVGMATKRDAEGQYVASVADNNGGLVDQRLALQQQQRRRTGGTPALIMRRPGAGEDRPPADQDKTPDDQTLQPDNTQQQQPNAQQPNPQLQQRKPK